MRVLCILPLFAVFAQAAPVRLTCEYLVNPLGIDSPTPRLSWQSDSTERAWRQSAYQILVASSPDRLRKAKPDVWDSGRQESSDSVSIPYGGPKLASGQRYYWTVRTWDSSGKMTQAAASAWWEVGLLGESDWGGAKWISREDAEEEADRAGIRWIWVPGQDGTAVPGGTRAAFRAEFDLKEKPRNAALYLLSRARFVAKVNGRDAGWKDGRYLEFDREDITDLVVTGKNTVEVMVTTAEARSTSGGMPTGGRGKETGAAGLAGLLKITSAAGSITRIPTGEQWQAQPLGESSWQPANPYAGLQDKIMEPNPGTLPGPAAYMRKVFRSSKRVRSAHLYATALGAYRMFLNGNRIGEDLLTPGVTDYRKRVNYQTYDVTARITRGDNVLAAILGDGWFGSGYSWIGIRFNFLPPPTRLLARLQITYADGSSETIVTDGSWKTSASPVLHSEIYAGEVYDARLEQAGWDKPGFTDGKWDSVVVSDPPSSVLSAEAAAPVRVVEVVTPKNITKAPNGSWLVDLGQNMAGWARLRVIGPAGTVVRMRFAEILGKDGNIYTENLRNANATDIYILRGGGEESFAPHFTYHGFRYIEVTGFPGDLTPESVVAEAISSAQHITGALSTSNDLINRMYRTAIWGQRSNFVSIPTDCPQRDERQGWMGDAQLFWRTGAYNADIAALGRKWMRDVRDAQTPEGAFTNTSPTITAGWQGPGTPGWADAGVIVPWTAWLQYGDTGIIAENWEAMEKHMAYVAEGNPDYLWRNRVAQNLGDWLPAGGKTPRDLIATAYWAYSAGRMSQMARALGRVADAERYSALFERIRTAFQKVYIQEDAVVGTGSQGSYALALYVDLVPDARKARAVENLVQDIEANQWHLTTGFLGTPPLLPVLAENDRTDVAYRLLLNETYPSWGYMLSKGATTWWERWNSDEGDPAMNSFNHFAFGSVVGWIYRNVAGIEAAAPGFKEIIIHPRLDPRITHARGEFDSVYGKIVSDWNGTSAGPFTIKVTIPANTRARVFLPAIANSAVTEKGKSVQFRENSGAYVVEVGSGSYEFLVSGIIAPNR
jgi:alpha-L-rhamnosidase